MRIPFRRPRGFTLIELMVSVAVIGILAAIAVPNYTEYVNRSSRSEARSTLVAAASWMEHRFGETNDYRLDRAAQTLFDDRFKRVPASGTQHYTVTVNVTDATNYTLTATPIDSMRGDSCGSFTLDNYGVKGLSGSERTVANCWGK